MDFNHPDIRFILETINKACVLVKGIRSNFGSKPLEKNDLSPVTVADYTVQAYIASRLIDNYPCDHLIAEEDSDLLIRAIGSEIRSKVFNYINHVLPGSRNDQILEWIDFGKAKPCDRFWVLDPIDGTKGYIRGGLYAIALALIENSKVILGALGCPNLGMDQSNGFKGTGIIFIAAMGQGAWMIPLESLTEPVQIHVSNINEPDKITISSSFEAEHTNFDLLEKFKNKYGARKPILYLDSQAKYALLAAGFNELYLRFLSSKYQIYKENIWDQAAGSLIIQEAGGTITDINGKILDFSTGRKLSNNQGIIASNGIIHQRAIDTLRKIIS